MIDAALQFIARLSLSFVFGLLVWVACEKIRQRRLQRAQRPTPVPTGRDLGEIKCYCGKYTLLSKEMTLRKPKEEHSLGCCSWFCQDLDVVQETKRL